MKPAIDVISHLSLDSEFSKHKYDFIVGYRGDSDEEVEESFDKISMNYDLQMFNIIHRILYFKYKKVVVWDKLKEIDLIFGSTESEKLSIEEIMELNLSEELSEFAYLNFSENPATNEIEDPKPEPLAMVMRSAPLRPTIKKTSNFLAIGISNKILAGALSSALGELCGHIPSLRPYRYSHSMMYISIMSMTLISDIERRNAVSILKNIANELKANFLSPKSLVVGGLASFHDSILYAKVVKSDFLNTFVKIVYSKFKEAGIYISSHKSDKLHVILAKLDPQTGRTIKLSKVLDSEFGKFVNCTFGTQDIDNLHLCFVENETKTTGGYISSKYQEDLY